jgi:uncharacterized protein (DUF2384 family)
MNRLLEETMLPASGLSDATGAVNIKTLSQKLDLEPAMLVETLGTNRQTVHHYMSGPARKIRTRDPRQREFWVKLDQVFTLLLALTDKHDKPASIRKWLNSPNRAMEMKKPIDLIYKGQLDTLIKKLMDVLTAAQGG